MRVQKRNRNTSGILKAKLTTMFISNTDFCSIHQIQKASDTALCYNFTLIKYNPSAAMHSC